MLNALLTDLDGVIRIWRATQDSDAERTVGLPSGAIKQVAFAPDLLLPAITGQLTDAAWRQQIVERLAQTYPTCDVARAVAIWSEPCGEVDMAMLHLLRRVRHNCPVCLVTNATSRLPADLARLGIFDEFDHIVNSSAVGWAKPEPAIFQAALRAVDVSAAAALFVDDSATNVAAAQALGLAGHHYQSYSQLVQVLESYGIL
jgi:putative hydrolase of the HAD superfamily